jgi:hypothetical protein
MQSENLNRRSFFLGIGSSVIGSALSLSSINIFASSQATMQPFENNTKQPAKYVSAASDISNNHYLVILDAEGKQLSKLALPARAHQVTSNPQATTLAIAARRPGTYLMIVNALSGALIQEIHPEAGHHFYGHSVYSADGRFLFTSENHIESGEGRIFVRDTTQNYKVARSFPSYGIGPHEIKIHPDNLSLVVANGGIHTHPDSGRAKLNLDTMSPSLAYISIETGELLEERKLPSNLHQASIRHIDINSQGLTAIAMQYEGDKTDNVPLIAIHQRGKEIKTLWAPEYVNRKLENYCGSVCFNQRGNIFAVTSPRGNTITLWDAENAEFIANLDCPDVCGISQSSGNGFTFSNGQGKLYQFNLKQATLSTLYQAKLLAWDNHLTLL